jgi:hypothetical protein
VKFKTIFFIFNAFILFAFLLLAVVPVLFLGPEYSGMFWERNWIIAVLFVLFISGLDAYFIWNWKLFNFLEQEDWPRLVNFLEEEIFTRRRFQKRYVGILINAYLSVSNLEKIRRLETEIREKAPGIHPWFALYLGTPLLLENRLDEAAEYFSRALTVRNVRFPGWIRWCLAFSVVSKNDIARSKDLFLEILKSEVRDPVLILLTLHLAGSMEKLMSASEAALYREKKEGFKTRWKSPTLWDRQLSRAAEDNLVILLFSSLIKTAYDAVQEELSRVTPAGGT